METIILVQALPEGREGLEAEVVSADRAALEPPDKVIAVGLVMWATILEVEVEVAQALPDKPEMLNLEATVELELFHP